jgi:hypothetical protein
MSNYYNSKKQFWVKVAFVLDRYGGDDKELSKATIVSLCSNLFPKQTPCTTGLPFMIKRQINQDIFQEICYTQKKKTIKLINENVLDEHNKIMNRWDQKIK